MTQILNTGKSSAVLSELRRCKAAFAAVALFSGFVNLLYLSGSIFMMEVYDRVLPSRSVPTLIGLVIIVATLYAFQALFDAIRGRLLLRIADRIDLALAPKVYDAIIDLQVRRPMTAKVSQPMRDLDTIRTFLSGSGPAAMFDLPWMPFYLAICFAFHFWIGVTALGGAIVLVLLTAFSEFANRRPMREAAEQALVRGRILDASKQNAELVAVLGMAPRLQNRWLEASRGHAGASMRANDLAVGLGALSKMLRMMLQSGVLAVGAYLVINDQASGGIIIASSILSGRALAPVDLAIANWKSFVAARQSKVRLDANLAQARSMSERMDLPAPHNALSVSNVSAAAPESQTVIVADVNFSLRPGSGLGIIGPSASGKSSLARLLVGAWAPLRGTVRLDGATLDQWPQASLARHIGYMPQATSLLDGSIAANIASFDPDSKPEDVLAAAEAAGVHSLILSLPDGYATRIDDSSVRLSAGQQQRIVLARALYGNPFLVVLDEPNSNLDAEGEEALTNAIIGVRQRGGIVVVVAHRPSALAGVDHVMVMANGRVQAFGAKDEILSTALRPVAVNPRREARAEGGAQ